MTAIFGRLIEFLRSLRLWVAVAPWEQGIAVRCGCRVRRMAPGLHLCIPVLDKVHVQNSRLRIVNVPTQTLSTSDGKTLIVGGSLCFRIVDLEKLLATLHQPEDALIELVQERVANHVSSSSSIGLTSATAAPDISRTLAVEHYGLAEVRFFVTDFAFVRTLRLIMDQRYASYGNTVQLEPPPID